MAINNGVNGMRPMQKIMVCCGGRKRARKAAQGIARALKKRRGIDIDTVNKIEIVSDDDEVDENDDYLINIHMNGEWTIHRSYDREMIDRSAEIGQQIHWRVLAWLMLERERPWPTLARLQWLLKTKTERGEPGMTKEAMREIYETENYYDHMYYETGERCKGIIDDYTAKKMQGGYEINNDDTVVATSSTYTTTLRDTAPYHKETTGTDTSAPETM